MQFESPVVSCTDYRDNFVKDMTNPQANLYRLFFNYFPSITMHFIGGKTFVKYESDSHTSGVILKIPIYSPSSVMSTSQKECWPNHIFLLPSEFEYIN